MIQTMESQPQNPEFRNNPEKFHRCITMPATYVQTYSRFLFFINEAYTLNPNQTALKEAFC